MSATENDLAKAKILLKQRFAQEIDSIASKHILVDYEKSLEAMLSKGDQVKIQFTDHLVCFLDVMGFKEILGGKNAELDISHYINAVLDVDELVKKNINSALQIVAVSDSIIIAVKIEKTCDFELLSNFIGAIATIQYNLAVLQGIWTRGAMAIGAAHIESSRNIVFGRGYLLAYEMERLADYPRVILHPSISEHFKMNPSEFTETLIEKFDALLVPFRLNPPIQLPSFTSDFIMIDWMKLGLQQADQPPYRKFESDKLTQDLCMELFFNNFTERQNRNPEIFLKSRKLLVYLLASLADSRSQSRDKKFAQQIAKRLESLTGMPTEYY